MLSKEANAAHIKILNLFHLLRNYAHTGMDNMDTRDAIVRLLGQAMNGGSRADTILAVIQRSFEAFAGPGYTAKYAERCLLQESLIRTLYAVSHVPCSEQFALGMAIGQAGWKTS